MDQATIYQLARDAGLPEANARVAAAVAMAESGGQPLAHTVDSDDDSYGLWQINMRGSMGPARRRQFGLKSDAALLDPATNARVMASISQQGRVWTAWGAFTNGSYKRFLSEGTGGKGFVDGVVDGFTGGASDLASSVVPYDVVNAAKKASEVADRVTSWVSNARNWVRVAYVFGGGALVLVSVGMLAGKPVTSALPIGKLAKLAKG